MLFWRAVLAGVLGLSAALLLAMVFPAFGVGPVALVTLLSFTAGMVWHAAAASPTPPPGTKAPEEKPVSRPLAFVGIAVMGVMWGSVAHYLLDSRIIALLLLVAAPFAFGPLAGVATRRPVYLNDLLFTSAALGAGFFTPWAIAKLFS
ncbi:hypothetical protein ACSFBM_25255 [Variovorax sp. GB1R11]|uniref:hypothetical protein n=1 Tax=Variovorax sp. GB1R11 TaxID=3443741 RepID=UPI003F472357